MELKVNQYGTIIYVFSRFLMSTLGERIRMIRRGESRESFSARLGISHSSLKRYESGEREPDAAFLDALIADQKISKHWLLTGEGNVYQEDFSELKSKISEPKTASEDVVKDELIESLRLIADLRQQLGESRLEVERLRFKAERLADRNAELEHQLAEALKPAQPAPMGNGVARVG